MSKAVHLTPVSSVTWKVWYGDELVGAFTKEGDRYWWTLLPDFRDSLVPSLGSHGGTDSLEGALQNIVYAATWDELFS